MNQVKSDQIRQKVRARYGSLTGNTLRGCTCSALPTCCSSGPAIVKNLAQRMGYSKEDLDSVTEGANMGLGCGNPLAYGKLKPGETVLDLGSGGGFDCFLAAQAVGENGRVIGVDMTPEMVSKARENAEKMGVRNVEFRLGEIEHLPAADSSVDVILSNCVINLSPEKRQVFREAFRVLKPGGRLAIADVVAIDALPENLRQQAALVTGCVAGAEPMNHLESWLAEIGFGEIRIRVRPQSRELIQQWLPGSGVERYVASADIEAVKPA